MYSIDMLQYVPERTLTGQRIVRRLNGDFLELQTMPKKGGRRSKLKVVRLIETDKQFWIGLGLLMAEGTKPGKRDKDKGRIAVTNSDPQVINIILHFFEKFGIQRSLWKGIVTANSYYIHSETDFIDRAKKYWSRRTNIPQENISVALYHRKPRKQRKTTPFGTLQIRLENIILNSLLQRLIEEVCSYPEESRRPGFKSRREHHLFRLKRLWGWG